MHIEVRLVFGHAERVGVSVWTCRKSWGKSLDMHIELRLVFGHAHSVVLVFGHAQ